MGHVVLDIYIYIYVYIYMCIIYIYIYTLSKSESVFTHRQIPKSFKPTLYPPHHLDMAHKYALKNKTERYIQNRLGIIKLCDSQ